VLGGRFMAKAGHWETGKAKRTAKFCNLLCKSTSQKTYESVLLLLARYKGDACRGKSAAVHSLRRGEYYFWEENAMNKKLIAIVIALAVLVAALAVVYFVTRPQATEGMKSFTVEIVHKDGTSKKLELKSDAEFLGEVLDEKGLIEYEEGQYGKFILKADGEKAVFEEDGAYWGFFIGEEYAMLGVDQTPIEEGKAYRLVYTIDDYQG
jgi:hypothetical protein